MRYPTLFAATILAALAPAGLAEPAGPSGPIVFRFAPQPGQTVRQRFVTKSVGTLGLAPGLPGAKFTQTSSQEIVGQCRQVNPDGSAIVDMTLDSIAMRMNTVGMTFEYDSKTFDPVKVDNPALRFIGRVYSAMVGSKVTTTFDARGCPVKMTGMKEAVAKAIQPIKQEISQDKSAAFLGRTIDDISKMFNDDTMLEQTKGHYRLAPDKAGPVAVGEKWEQNWSMNIPVLNSTCNIKGQYELLGIETFRGRPCAKIGIKESFATGPNPAQAGGSAGGRGGPALAGLSQMDMTLNASSGDGTAYWDYEHGLLVQLRQTQRIAINVKYKFETTQPSGTDQAETGPAEGKNAGAFSQNVTTSFQVDLVEGEAGQTTTRAATTGPANR